MCRARLEDISPFEEDPKFPSKAKECHDHMTIRDFLALARAASTNDVMQVPLRARKNMCVGIWVDEQLGDTQIVLLILARGSSPQDFFIATCNSRANQGELFCMSSFNCPVSLCPSRPTVSLQWRPKGTG